MSKLCNVSIEEDEAVAMVQRITVSVRGGCIVIRQQHNEVQTHDIILVLSISHARALIRSLTRVLPNASSKAG